MGKHFTHLHLHTEFSLLDGAIRIPKLLAMAKEQDWQDIGITDHGNIFGAIKFFQAAKKEKIKPILGVEMYFTQDVRVKDPNDRYYHLVLLVQNNEGYKNLCKMLAYSYQDGFYFKPRIDYALLEKHASGLIATSACIGGHIPSLFNDGNYEEATKRVQWFKDLFGPERFFLELHPPETQEQKKVNSLIVQCGKDFGLQCTTACDAHYMSKEDREAHEVLLAVQTKDTMDNPKRYSFGEYRCHMRTTQEMFEIFKDNEEALWQSGAIADRCEFDFVFGKLFF